MSQGRIIGAGAYVAVALLLGLGAWWVITSGEGPDRSVDDVVPAREDQRGRVEVWDGVGFSIVRDRTAEDRQTDPHIEDGEPEEGIVDVALDWVRGLSAITTVLGFLGWLIGAIRNEGRPT